VKASRIEAYLDENGLVRVLEQEARRTYSFESNLSVDHPGEFTYVQADTYILRSYF
jgi:hypothetical protein